MSQETDTNPPVETDPAIAIFKALFDKRTFGESLSRKPNNDHMIGLLDETTLDTKFKREPLEKIGDAPVAAFGYTIYFREKLDVKSLQAIYSFFTGQFKIAGIKPITTKANFDGEPRLTYKFEVKDLERVKGFIGNTDIIFREIFPDYSKTLVKEFDSAKVVTKKKAKTKKAALGAKAKKRPEQVRKGHGRTRPRGHHR